MATDKSSESETCAVVKCPPLQPIAAPDFVGMTIAKLRKDDRVKDKLEVAEGAPATVSKDHGLTYGPVSEDYEIEKQDVVEFTRGSSTKG